MIYGPLGAALSTARVTIAVPNIPGTSYPSAAPYDDDGIGSNPIFGLDGRKMMRCDDNQLIFFAI